MRVFKTTWLGNFTILHSHGSLKHESFFLNRNQNLNSNTYRYKIIFPKKSNFELNLHCCERRRSLCSISGGEKIKNKSWKKFESAFNISHHRSKRLNSSIYAVRTKNARADAGEWGSGGIIRPDGGYNFNLDEYMVTLEKPIGILFAQSENGTVYVEALAQKGNAENSKMIMVGDVLKKTSAVFGDTLWDVDDFNRVMYAIKARNGSVSLVLERSSQPTQNLKCIVKKKKSNCNPGRVGFAAWHNPASENSKSENFNYENSSPSNEFISSGKIGYVSFSSTHTSQYNNIDTNTFPLPLEKNEINPVPLPSSLNIPLQDNQNIHKTNEKIDKKVQNHENRQESFEIQDELKYEGEELAKFFIGAGLEAEAEASENELNFGEEWKDSMVSDDSEAEGLVWSNMESYEEYFEALQRSAGDLRYEHDLGLNFSQVTPQLYIGSCLQKPDDVYMLTRQLGVTAVLDLQLWSDQLKWEVNRESLLQTSEKENLLVIHRPIRGFDSHDLRLSLPAVVGTLHRLLRFGHTVIVTSTAGLGRAPTCIIAYLHWTCSIPLSDAYDFIVRLRPSAPNRCAIVAATWDLIAMVNKSQKLPTHAVQLIWNHGGKEVLLVGEFFGGWNKPTEALPIGGQKFALEMRLPQGKYRYKFIVDGQWRHAWDLPTEIDEWGNTNNIIFVGGKYSHPSKDFMKERVLERPLTAKERHFLTFAITYATFKISAIDFYPKK